MNGRRRAGWSISDSRDAGVDSVPFLTSSNSSSNQHPHRRGMTLRADIRRRSRSPVGFPKKKPAARRHLLVRIRSTRPVKKADEQDLAGFEAGVLGGMARARLRITEPGDQSVRSTRRRVARRTRRLPTPCPSKQCRRHRRLRRDTHSMVASDRSVSTAFFVLR